MAMNVNMASEDAGRLANRRGGPRRRARGDTGERGAGGRRGTGRSTGNGAGPKVVRARRSLPPPDAGLRRPSLRLLPPRTRPPCSTVAFSTAPPCADGRGRRPMGAAARARRSQRERVDGGRAGRGRDAAAGLVAGTRSPVLRGRAGGLRDRIPLCDLSRAWGGGGRVCLLSILSLGCGVDSSGIRP